MIFTHIKSTLKKETLQQEFTCAFWELSENTFFTERLGVTPSKNLLVLSILKAVLIDYHCQM